MSVQYGTSHGLDLESESGQLLHGNVRSVTMSRGTKTIELKCLQSCGSRCSSRVTGAKSKELESFFQNEVWYFSLCTLRTETSTLSSLDSEVGEDR